MFSISRRKVTLPLVRADCSLGIGSPQSGIAGARQRLISVSLDGICINRTLAVEKGVTPKRSRVSAGLLMFRRRNNSLEFLLVHPGGPFWKNKDDGAWTIPKGEAAEDEDLLTRAQTEFQEELGFKPSGEWISLGSIKQKGGKTVHAWAFEGDLPEDFVVRSNTFQLEYPPRSGRFKEFPEIDRAEFFPDEIARKKMNVAQIAFLDRLRDALGN